MPTPAGDALVVLEQGRGRPRGLLVLGHGAGGGITAVDLVAVRDEALRAGCAVARVTQPYRVAARRRPPPATAVLDTAWVAAVAATRERVAAAGGAAGGAAGDTAGLAAGPAAALVVGGRSSGARVACRTARAVGAVGVLALAFPLHPPGRPAVTRAAELDPGVDTLVINGERDPFGVPEADGLVRVVVLPGERHDLSRDPGAVAVAAMAWLKDRLAGPRRRPTDRSAMA